METVKFVYDDKEIEFELLKDEVMVNATEMGAVFGKKPYDFYHTKTVKSLIKAFCETEGYNFDNEFSPSGKLVNVVQGGCYQGTWMHRFVAMKFAAWLSSEFDVWVQITIDKLINSRFSEQQQAFQLVSKKNNKKEMERNEIIRKYGHLPEIAEYFELEEQEKWANIRTIRQGKIQSSN